MKQGHKVHTRKITLKFGSLGDLFKVHAIQ